MTPSRALDVVRSVINKERGVVVTLVSFMSNRYFLVLGTGTPLARGTGPSLTNPSAFTSSHTSMGGDIVGPGRAFQGDFPLGEIGPK